MSDPLGPHRLLCPWNSPGRNTRVGCHFLLQETFPTQGLNLCLLHCRQILYHLSNQGSVIIDALNPNDSVHILLTTLNPMAIPNLEELGNSNPTMCLEKWKLVAQSCPSLWDPMDCSPPGNSVHGTLQARILEWAAIPFSRGSSRPRD